MRRAIEAHIFARFPEVSDLLAPYAVSTHAAFATKFGLDPQGERSGAGAEEEEVAASQGSVASGEADEGEAVVHTASCVGPLVILMEGKRARDPDGNGHQHTHTRNTTLFRGGGGRNLG